MAEEFESSLLAAGALGPDEEMTVGEARQDADLPLDHDTVPEARPHDEARMEAADMTDLPAVATTEL